MREDSAYLSIDLDYWCGHNDARSSGRFFKKVFDLDVPKIFVIEHEELLPDVNRCGANILYNVDFHSDLCSINELGCDEEPEDGTWVNFVRWRNSGTFHWIVPNMKECYNNGRGEGCCCGNPDDDPFRYEEHRSWGNVNVTSKMRTINWNIVERIGICLSPCFVYPETVKTVIKKFGVCGKQVEALVKKQPLESPKRRTRGTLAQIA